MQRCTLDGIRSLERLRGVGMRWDDVLASAGAFAGVSLFAEALEADL